MSTIITNVAVYSQEFFKGFLDAKEDPVYYALAEMHDLLVRQKAEKNDEALVELKMLLKVLLDKRKKATAVTMPKVNDLVRIIPRNQSDKEFINERGDIGRVGKIGDTAIMIVNRDCDDVMSDLGNFIWGAWFEFGKIELEIVNE